MNQQINTPTTEEVMAWGTMLDEMGEHVRGLMVDEGMTRPEAVRVVAEKSWSKVAKIKWLHFSMFLDYLGDSVRITQGRSPQSAPAAPAARKRNPNPEPRVTTAQIIGIITPALDAFERNVTRDVLSWALSHPGGAIALANATVEDFDEAIAALERQASGLDRLIGEHRAYRAILQSEGITRASGRTGRDVIGELAETYMELRRAA